MQWKGLYQILKRVSKVDYQLDVKVKTYHANMLKWYVERCEPTVQCVMSIVNSENIDEHDVEDGEVEEFLEGQSQESINNVDINPNLREGRGEADHDGSFVQV